MADFVSKKKRIKNISNVTKVNTSIFGTLFQITSRYDSLEPVGMGVYSVLILSNKLKQYIGAFGLVWSAFAIAQTGD